MKHYNRKAIKENLNKYCYLAEEHDYIEICKWHNGEGFDVSIGDRCFQVSYCELEAINVLVNVKE